MHMAIHDLPDMYALSPWAQASGIHIRQIPHGHVTTNLLLIIKQGMMYNLHPT